MSQPLFINFHDNDRYENEREENQIEIDEQRLLLILNNVIASNNLFAQCAHFQPQR